MNVETIREVDSGGAPKQVLVKAEDGRHFLVSTVVAFDTGKMETLVFAADESGHVADYAQLAGGIGQTRSEAIADLEARLDTGLIDGIPDAYLDEVGGPMGAGLAALSMMADSVMGRPVNAEPDDEALL
jgi:hypothetical protein